MHPYRMQRLIERRGKDEVVNVRHRARLYQAIARLDRDGMIAVRETQRVEGRPKRTVYELTEAGRSTIDRWLREMVAVPASEYPAFPAVLSFIYLLEPDRARAALSRRAAALLGERDRLDRLLEEHADSETRLFLLQLEYIKPMKDAEYATPG